GRGGSESVEGAQGVGGLRLVARAQAGVVGVRDVAGGVLEVQLAQRAQGRALGLGELFALVGRQGQQRRGLVALTQEGPEREGGGLDGQHEREDDGAHLRSVSSSRRMRSLIAASTGGGGALPRRRRVHRRSSSATTVNPTAIAASGNPQTSRLNPVRRGARRIHSP